MPIIILEIHSYRWSLLMRCRPRAGWRAWPGRGYRACTRAPGGQPAPPAPPRSPTPGTFSAHTTLFMAYHVTCHVCHASLLVWAVTFLVWVAVVVVLLVPLSVGQPLHSVMSCHVKSCHVMSRCHLQQVRKDTLQHGEGGVQALQYSDCHKLKLVAGCRGRVQSGEYLMVNAQHTIH